MGAPRGCIRKMNSSWEKASQAVDGMMSTGEKAIFKRATKELRHADKETDVAASCAAKLNWDAGQERGLREWSSEATAKLLVGASRYRVCECEEQAGNEAAKLVSLQRSLPAG